MQTLSKQVSGAETGAATEAVGTILLHLKPYEPLVPGILPAPGWSCSDSARLSICEPVINPYSAYVLSVAAAVTVPYCGFMLRCDRTVQLQLHIGLSNGHIHFGNSTKISQPC